MPVTYSTATPVSPYLGVGVRGVESGAGGGGGTTEFPRVPRLTPTARANPPKLHFNKSLPSQTVAGRRVEDPQQNIMSPNGERQQIAFPLTDLKTVPWPVRNTWRNAADAAATSSFKLSGTLCTRLLELHVQRVYLERSTCLRLRVKGHVGRCGLWVLQW